MDKRHVLNIVLAVIIVALLFQIRNQESAKDWMDTMVQTSDTTHVMHAKENDHEKKSFGPKVAIYPEPAMVIGSYSADSVPNIMSASWFGIVCSRPLKIAVSLRPATHSYHNIMASGAFTVNIPNDELAPYVAFVGKYSGRDIDKFKVGGFTPVLADSVHAPYVKEFPIVLECKLSEYHDLGSHRMFIGEVISTKIDQYILNEKDHVRFDRFTPLIVGPGGYFRNGSYIGKGKDLRKVYEERMNKAQ